MIRKIILGLAFVIAAFVLWPKAAPADEFAECMRPGYLSYFDDRLTPQMCEEVHVTQINWRGGHAIMRAIRLSSSPMTDSAGFIRDIDAAAAAIGRAMDRMQLGSGSLPTVTVLFSNYASPPRPRDNTFRKGAYIAAASDIIRGECPVGYFKLREGGDSDKFVFTLAHEVFHCIQFNTWPDFLDEGWIQEGTAEYFAYLAKPDYRADFIAEFDNTIQGTALPRLVYPAVAFWLWMGHQDGPTTVRDFIPAATTDMEAQIPADRWLDFGKAYFDGTIKMPDGATPMPSTPRIGEAHVISADLHVPSPSFAPYTLHERQIEFARGKRYRITYGPRPDDAKFVWRKADGGAWGDPPTEVDTCEGAQRFRLLYASTNSFDFGDMDIRVESGPTVCTCPAGTWEETPESLRRYFEQPSIPGGNGAEFITGGRRLQLNSDHTGSFTYESVETITRTPGDPTFWLRQVKTGGTHFTWKVVNGMLLTVMVPGNNLLTLANEQHTRSGAFSETRRAGAQSIGHLFRCDSSGLHLIQPPRPPSPIPGLYTTFRSDMDFARASR